MNSKCLDRACQYEIVRQLQFCGSFFRFILLWVIVVFSLGFDGFSQDSLVCYEISSRSNLVQSSPLQIPAGMTASISFESNNRQGEMAFSQGCLLQIEGRTFVKYQADYRLSYTNDSVLSAIWARREFAFFSSDPESKAKNLHSVRGPCTISFFCKSAAMKGTVYLAPDLTGSRYYTNKLFRASEGSFRIVLPPNTIADISDHEYYGSQSPAQTVLSGQGNQFSSTNILAWTSNVKNKLPRDEPKDYGSFQDPGTWTNVPSRVVTWAKIWSASSNGGRTVYRKYIGPATITYTYTNRSDVNSFTRLRYYISPVSISYNNLFSKNTSFPKEGIDFFKNKRLVLEKSKDGKKWVQAPGGILTNTIEQASYRFRLEQI